MTIQTLSEEFGTEPHGIRALLALEDAGTDYTPIEEFGWTEEEARAILSSSDPDEAYL